MTIESPVAVAICTFNRPQRLRDLLATLAQRTHGEVASPTLPVVVVDDSDVGTARPVVDAVDGPLSVRYVHTGSADISTARNAALTTAAEMARYVACIDDDCVPQDGWLRELLRISETGADIVVGHRQFVADDDAPAWLRQEPFLAENAVYPDGSVPSVGNIANVLIKSDWLRTSGIRFRSDLGHLGGEDMVFLSDAAAAGADTRFAAYSVVLEPCEPRRQLYGYQLWRQFWLGNNEAHIAARVGGLSRPRLVLRSLRRMGRGVVWPLRASAQRRRPETHWAFALFASGAGLFLGAIGIAVRHRS
jgi:glycosyltransferase involved in cell wall biosynthesis